jgi:hypothetical protein
MSRIVGIKVQDNETFLSPVEDITFPVTIFSREIAEDTSLVFRGADITHSPRRKEMIQLPVPHPVPEMKTG